MVIHVLKSADVKRKENKNLHKNTIQKIQINSMEGISFLSWFDSIGFDPMWLLEIPFGSEFIILYSDSSWI